MYAYANSVYYDTLECLALEHESMKRERFNARVSAGREIASHFRFLRTIICFYRVDYDTIISNCHSPDHSPSKIDPGASSFLQATLFILSRLKENKFPSFSHRLLLKELQLICGDSWCVIFPRFLN